MMSVADLLALARKAILDEDARLVLADAIEENGIGHSHKLSINR